MRSRAGPNGSADKHVKEIERKTRRKFSAEEKIRIILDAGQSLYGYVGQDPLGAIDPEGLRCYGMGCYEPYKSVRDNTDDGKLDDAALSLGSGDDSRAVVSIIGGVNPKFPGAVIQGFDAQISGTSDHTIRHMCGVHR